MCFTHSAVIIGFISLMSRGVSHNRVAMFYVSYTLTLKKQLSIDCVAYKVRDEAEETVER
jgi:hypothetical protein